MKRRLFFKLGLVFLLALTFVWVLFLLFRGGEFERPFYEVVDLSGDVGAFNSVMAFNDNGQIAGLYWRGDGRQGSAVWDKKNGLVKFPEVKDLSYRIWDINNKGEAVGVINRYSGQSPFRPKNSMGETPTSICGFFRDVDGVISELSYEDGTITNANRINDEGLVAGVIVSGGSDQNRGISHKLFTWDKVRGMRVIERVEGVHIHVGGINEAGQVAGMVNSKDGIRTFLWSEREGVLFGYALAGQVIGIDDEGSVGGEYLTSKGELFLWDKKEGVQSVGIKGDNLAFLKINGKGDIVGTVTDRGIFIWRYALKRSEDESFLYTREGKKFALDALFKDDEQFYPSGINDKRWIVGKVRDRMTGNTRAVLLRPE